LYSSTCALKRRRVRSICFIEAPWSQKGEGAREDTPDLFSIYGLGCSKRDSGVTRDPTRLP